MSTPIGVSIGIFAVLGVKSSHLNTTERNSLTHLGSSYRIVLQHISDIVGCPKSTLHLEHLLVNISTVCSSLLTRLIAIEHEATEGSTRVVSNLSKTSRRELSQNATIR